MRLIPHFFLRTSIRILLLQTFIAWLWIHVDKIPLPTLVNLALCSISGMTVNVLKDTLDVRLGFVLPWDTPYFLPMLLDRYIVATMPELAVLLGESPCSQRIARVHPETGFCEQELAYACSQHAVGFETGKLGLEFLRACYQDYGISPTVARKHHDRCHTKEKQNSIISRRACTRAKEQIEKNKEVCFYIPPIMDCTIQYERWEDIGKVLKPDGLSQDEHRERGVCDKRVLGDTYIHHRFRGYMLVTRVEEA